jgi:hypothetical protein
VFDCKERLTMNGTHSCDEHHHDHQTPHSPLEPAIDAETGRLEEHCSRCGADISSADELCHICAIEMAGGELPPEDDQERETQT